MIAAFVHLAALHVFELALPGAWPPSRCKDLLILHHGLAAIIVIPIQLADTARLRGGWPAAKDCCWPAAGKNQRRYGYATIALGSALAIFLYSHSLTGILRRQQRPRPPGPPQCRIAAGRLVMIGCLALLGKRRLRRRRQAAWMNTHRAVRVQTNFTTVPAL